MKVIIIHLHDKTFPWKLHFFFHSCCSLARYNKDQSVRDRGERRKGVRRVGQKIKETWVWVGWIAWLCPIRAGCSWYFKTLHSVLEDGRRKIAKANIFVSRKQVNKVYYYGQLIIKTYQHALEMLSGSEAMKWVTVLHQQNFRKRNFDL